MIEKRTISCPDEVKREPSSQVAIRAIGMNGVPTASADGPAWTSLTSRLNRHIDDRHHPAKHNILLSGEMAAARFALLQYIVQHTPSVCAVWRKYCINWA